MFIYRFIVPVSSASRPIARKAACWGRRLHLSFRASYTCRRGSSSGEGVLAGPNGKRFDTIEKLPGFDTANDQHTVGISGKNITDLGNGSFQVTNGQITIKTVSENGTTTFTTYDIRGNSYAIVSQPPNGGPISVKVGSASN
jgi:hypothetical protein